MENKISDLCREKLSGAIAYLQSLPEFQRIPLTMSLDVRRNDHKLTVVDANIYPAGHNNIHPTDFPRCSDILKEALQRRGIKEGSKIGIVPERLTKNMFYCDNLAILGELLELGGFQVSFFWPYKDEAPPVLQGSGTSLVTKALNSEKVDAFILNYDGTGGPLDLPSEVPTFPSPLHGWNRRHKSDFFRNFNELLSQVEQKFGMDLDSMKIAHKEVPIESYEDDASIKRLYDAALELHQELTEKYKQKNIPFEPSYFIKNNSGTYGLGVLGIRSPDEILHLNNRKTQNLSLSKGRVGISSVMIQEGVPSNIGVSSTCEEVYMAFGGELAARFMRCHDGKTAFDSLNAIGMKLVPIPASSPTSLCPECERFLVLASGIACAREII